MKSESHRSPKGPTTILVREDEAIAVIEDRSPKGTERIDIDFSDHVIRVYSDRPWPVEAFKRSGNPVRRRSSHEDSRRTPTKRV